MSIFERLRKCVNALWQIAMRRCVTGMCYRDVLRCCVMGRMPTRSYWITELVGVFLIILLWFRSRDLLKYLSIVLW